MKKLMWGAALLALAAPNAAFADTASVGVHTANVDVEGSDEYDFWGLDGGWSHEFSGGWVIQADGQHDNVDLDVIETGASYGAVALGMRTDRYAAYGFIGLSDILAASGTSYGAGGQLYFDRFTLDASVSRTDIEGGLFFDGETTAFRLGGMYFFMPNLGVGAELTSAEAELLGTSMDGDGYAINAIYRFNGPVAITGRYRHDDWDGGEMDALLFGVSLNFGTESAQEQINRGPNWTGARRAYEDTFVFLN
jgi:hypothetical protein